MLTVTLWFLIYFNDGEPKQLTYFETKSACKEVIARSTDPKNFKCFGLVQWKESPIVGWDIKKFI